MNRTLLTALLVALTVGVQVAAVWVVADPFQAVQNPAPVRTAENQPTTAVPLLGVIVAELAVVWLAWMVFGQLPNWLRRWVARGAKAGAVLYALLYAAVIMHELVIIYAVMLVAYGLGYAWVAFDIGALTLSVVIAATLGGYFGPAPLVVLLVALIVYDYIAVNKTAVMGEVVQLVAKLGLPVLFVIPKRARFDLNGFLDALAADGADLGEWRGRVHTVIGGGDFAVPAALTAAAFRYTGGYGAAAVLAGTVGGMVLLGRHIGDKALPGLPWLGGGALCGLGAAILIT